MSSNISTLSGSVNGDDSNVNDDDNEKFKPVTIHKYGGFWCFWRWWCQWKLEKFKPVTILKHGRFGDSDNDGGKENWKRVQTCNHLQA